MSMPRLTIAQFVCPRELYIRRGSLMKLRILQGKKAAIIIGKGSMRTNGYMQKVCDLLKQAGLKTVVFDGILPNPTVTAIQDLAGKLQAFEPDWVVALGGGSVIDASKGAWILYEHPDSSLTNMLRPFSVPPLRSKARLIAIPSTSGTGAEVSSTAVITVPERGTKHPIMSHELLPDIAILDSSIAMTMPPKMTADTGFDALTHAIEAYVSTINNVFASSLAAEAVRLILAYLTRAYENGDDREARECMHQASSLAGLAQNNVSVGLVHSLAHQVGTFFDVSHGRANSLFLTDVIRFNSESTERYDLLARIIGLEGTDALIETVEVLKEKVKMPRSLKEVGVESPDFQKKFQTLVDNTLSDVCTRTNPLRCSPKDVESILLQVK